MATKTIRSQSSAQERQERIIAEVEREMLRVKEGGKSFTEKDKKKEKSGKSSKSNKLLVKKGQKGFGEEKSSKLISAREALHITLLEEAGRLAFNSEEPWKDLIRVAIAQWNFGWKEEAQNTFDVAADLAVDPDEPKSGSRALADVVRGLLRSKLIYRAIDTVERIPESEIKGEAQAEIIVSLARRGRIQDLKAAERIASNMTSQLARNRALIKLAEIQAYHHGADAGLESLEELIDQKEKSKGMQQVALSRIRRQDFESARDVIERIPDDERRDYAFVQLVSRHAKRHEFPLATEIASMIGDSKQYDRAVNQIALAQGRAHQGGDAIRTASEITDSKIKERAFEQILRAEARSGGVRSAIKLTGLIRDEEVKDRVFGDIASEVTAKVGAWNGRKIAQLTRASDERARALRLVAISSARRGDSKQGVETARQIREPKERLLALAKIADDKTNHGRGKFAFSILKNEELLLKRVVLDESPELKRPISMAFAANGEASEALAVLDQLPNLAQRDHGYRDLARRFGEQKKMRRGVEALDKISNEKLKLKARNEFLSALARSTPPEQALGAMKHLNSTADKVEFLIKVLDRI